MKTTPVISVLMSVYNENEAQIVESVHSMIEQSFRDFELIIVIDNPQRDDIQGIIDQFADDRIRIIRNESNIGLAMSMNVAASYARAKIFARMDADDIAELNRFEVEYDILCNKKADVVFSNYSFINMESDVIDGNYKRKYIEGYVDPEEIALRPNVIHHPTVMMKRGIFEAVGGYRDFPCAQDTDLWLRMQEHGAVFYRTEEKLLKYRISTQGTTQSKYFKQQLTAHYIYKLSIERLVSGNDSYSIANYNTYLLTHGVNSKYNNNLFGFGLKCLRREKITRYPLNLIIRAFVFLIVPQLRHYYLLEIKKKKIIKKNRKARFN